jgi:hypothetical protein
MDLRTTFEIPYSDRKITYYDPVMFIGSCFATSIGRQFELGHMPVMINPSGTIYNPVSACNTLNTITGGGSYGITDLYNYEGAWISFNHYTDFSSPNPEALLDKINKKSAEAFKFISSARFLFITFGTARVYRWNETGKIVSNCHKIPASKFTRELLTADYITSLWKDQLDKLQSLFPELKVVFTISPVRHWKDGAHGNQVSKSVLFIAVEELLKHPSVPGYFPAYELLMDDLRDYRFYDEDMLHPSNVAVDYIWNAFTHCYFDNNTMELWQEVFKINRAVSHRIRTGSEDQTRKFAETMLGRIGSLTGRIPGLNLEKEKEYFRNLGDNSKKSEPA